MPEQEISEEFEKKERVKVLHTMDLDLHKWLRSESRRSGRSVSFMIELAVTQWRDKLERGRKS
jgi:hypothetical protein